MFLSLVGFKPLNLFVFFTLAFYVRRRAPLPEALYFYLGALFSCNSLYIQGLHCLGYTGECRFSTAFLSLCTRAPLLPRPLGPARGQQRLQEELAFQRPLHWGLLFIQGAPRGLQALLCPPASQRGPQGQGPLRRRHRHLQGHEGCRGPCEKEIGSVLIPPV